MSRARMLAGFLASVLGLAVGIASGVPEGKALARRMFTLRAAAIENELSVFSAMQFEHADSEHARQAVLHEIHTLESLARQSPRFATRLSAQSVAPQRDAALYLAYARLALVEQAAGDASGAQAAQAQARDYWSQLHSGAQLTPAQMAQSVREFDRACAASP